MACLDILIWFYSRVAYVQPYPSLQGKISTSIAVVLRVGHEDTPSAILFICRTENIKSSQLIRIHESIEPNVNRHKVITYFSCKGVTSRNTIIVRFAQTFPRLRFPLKGRRVWLHLGYSKVDFSRVCACTSLFFDLFCLFCRCTNSIPLFEQVTDRS